MSVVRFILKLIVWLSYAIFAAIVLYFPFAELLTYIARETRLFRFRPTLGVEDSLLPCLGLAVIYAVASVLRRRLEPETDTSGENAQDQPGE